MCVTAVVPMLASLTAAGTAGSGLSALGTAVSVAGSLYQGVSTYQTNQRNSKAAVAQAGEEAYLSTIEDHELRKDMAAQAASQKLSLAKRGIAPDSPTAIMLGRVAAEETAKASSKVRRRGRNRVEELSAEARNYRARAKMGLITGAFSGAGSVLQAAPKIWPGLQGEVK